MSRGGCWDHRPAPVAIRALHRWSAGDSTEVAAALSFAREWPGDWAPDAVSWFFGWNDLAADLIGGQLIHAVLVASGRAGFLPTPDALAAAVGDAMVLLRDPGAPTVPPNERRARQFKMRKERFSFMKSTANMLLRDFIRRGFENYIRALGLENTGPDRRAPTNPYPENHEQAVAA